MYRKSHNKNTNTFTYLDVASGKALYSKFPTLCHWWYLVYLPQNPFQKPLQVVLLYWALMYGLLIFSTLW